MKHSSQVSLLRVAEIELTYRSIIKKELRLKVRDSKDAYEIFMANWDLGKIEFMEQFKVLFLNRAYEVLGLLEVSTGGISGTVADPKIMFAAGIKAMASYMILCHNHPSGNLKPSEPDIYLTRKMVEAGKLLDLPVRDHLIISSGGYYSFADEGKI